MMPRQVSSWIQKTCGFWPLEQVSRTILAAAHHGPADADTSSSNRQMSV